jgi:hypothetical protein
VSHNKGDGEKMNPSERETLRAIERRVALENEIERRNLEKEIAKLQEEANPTTKVRMRQIYNEMKDLRVKLPKIVVK